MSFKIKDGLVVGANLIIDASGNIVVPGKLTTSNTNAAAASFNLGTAAIDPTSPVAGDVWYNSGVVRVRNGSNETKVVAYTDSTVSNATNFNGFASSYYLDVNNHTNKPAIWARTFAFMGV